MGSREGVEDVIEEGFFMHLECKRLETFESWPFQEDCMCTPQHMAAAGFYHCGSDAEPDYVRCFVCRKELDGWEPDDDPLVEHKKHSKDCKFLKMKTITEELTLEEFYKLTALIRKAKSKKQMEDSKREFQTLGTSVREKMEKLI